jgi:hypothetical protein
MLEVFFLHITAICGGGIRAASNCFNHVDPLLTFQKQEDPHMIEVLLGICKLRKNDQRIKIQV